MDPKRERFVREYLLDLCAARAARRAGYSVRSAREMGHRLIHDPQVLQAIEEAKAARAARAGVQADAVIAEIHALAFDAGGRDQDRLRALELLGKHLGLFPDRHEHTGKDGGPIQHAAVQIYLPDNGRDARR